jgi:ADP-heptose:LPS heptosyltransferase
VLLVRFSAIGDCVMAAWAAASIRQSLPEAELFWAVETRCAPVVAPGLASVIEYPRDRWKKEKWRRWREEMALYSALRRFGFEWGLDLQGHSKTALLLRFSGAKRRLAARATDAFAARLNPLVPGDPRSMQVVEWNQLALGHLGKFERVERPPMPPLASGPEPRLATICVGAGSEAKLWPVERWAEVARRLVSSGFRVVFLGGPGDPMPEPVAGSENLIGKLPLLDSVRMVGASGLHLAADTGTGHMAAAYGVRAISIFGPTPVSVFRPYSSRTTVLRRSERTEDVTVEDVMEAVCAEL